LTKNLVSFSRKSGKVGIYPQNRVFRGFCPFLAKNGFFRGFWTPEGVPGQGFYINPSRRGPAVPGAGAAHPQAAQARGRPP